MKPLKNELLHWIILAVPFIYLASVYGNLPDVIPTHFDINSTPNNYVHKTMLLWETPLFTIGLYLVMFFIPKIAQKKLLVIAPKTIYRLRLLFTLVFSALAVVIIYMSQPEANLKLATSILLAVVVILIITAITFFYTLYKKIYAQPAPTPFADTKDFYKWGMFYYNPGDKRFFVPKLIGIGWTLNFANPFSYIIMAVIFAFIIWSLLRLH